MKNQEIIQTGKKVFQSEVKELLNISQNMGDEFAQAVKILHETKNKVVVTGVGKSAHIANKMVATFNSTGTQSQFLHAVEAIHGDLGLLDRDDTVICLSKSGNSQEIKDLIPLLKNRAAHLIAITCNRESDLGKNADVVLDIKISREAEPNDLAPTSSTTAQLVMGDALAVALMELNHFTGEDFAQFHPGGVLGKRLIWTVNDVMDSFQRPFVAPDSPAFEVIDSITSGKHGITTVIENGKTIGVITDGDLRRMLKKYRNIGELKAADMYTANPQTINKKDKAIDALHKLRDHNIGQLVVLNDDDSYFGILDLHILLKHGFEL